MVSSTHSLLSSMDTVLLQEAIHECLSADSEQTLRERVFPSIQKLFDFDFGGAVLCNTSACGKVVVARFFDLSMPLEFCIEYGVRDLFTQDAVSIDHFRTYEPQYWSNLTQHHRLARAGVHKKLTSSDTVQSLLIDFGMPTGYTHGCPVSFNGEGGSFCSFQGPAIRFEPRTVEILEQLMPHVHMALLRTAAREPDRNDAVLSSREKQVLHWLKEGKSSWEISVVLKISERTVNFHVYNLIHKLGAVNRSQAVAVAMAHGLLALE